MRLLWEEPGNEALKAENEGRVWEPGYCGERLGARLRLHQCTIHGCV